MAIAESHLSIHTWPELDYAAADIFTCGSSFQPQGAAQLLIDRLKSKDPSMQIIRRGIEVPTPATRS